MLVSTTATRRPVATLSDPHLRVERDQARWVESEFGREFGEDPAGSGRWRIERKDALTREPAPAASHRGRRHASTRRS